MDLDVLLQRLGAEDVRFPVADRRIAEASAPGSVDALFHLPLLALAIMTAARNEPLATVALGRTVARLLVARFAALRDSPTTLERSVTMRRRVVEALVFLESASLVAVSGDDKRVISLTQEGKTKLDRARRVQDEKGFFLKHLRGAQGRALAQWGDQ